MVGLSVHGVAVVYTVGAAMLGLWAVVRFPRLGPQTLSSSFVVVACAFVLLLASGVLARIVLGLAGTTAVLLGVFLPVLTVAFWSGAHTVRVGVERLAPFRR